MTKLVPYESFDINETLQNSDLEHVKLYEAFEQITSKLEEAIKNKFVCKIDYRGPLNGVVLDGVRMVEPVAVGVDTSGSLLLRAWLIRGISKTGKVDPRLVPGWRLFRIDRIRLITPTLEKFDKARKGYNADDKVMSEVMFSVTF